MQGSINNPGVQTERTQGKAGQLQQLANALFAVIMAALFIAGFFGMAVYYIVNSVEDRAALTLIFCFIGIAVFAAVVGVVGIGLYFIRNMGAAIVEHQSVGTASTQSAFVHGRSVGRGVVGVAKLNGVNVFADFDGNVRDFSTKPVKKFAGFISKMTPIVGTPGEVAVLVFRNGTASVEVYR